MSNIREVIDLNLGAKNDTWKEYSLSEAPILLRGLDQKLTDSKQYKAIMRKGELAAIVSQRYSVLPNEEALKLTKEAIPEGFTELDAKYSRDGNALFAYFIDARRYAVDSGAHLAAGKEDEVSLGFMMRNSIDGSTGFGMELFSYRWLCTNGAIVGHNMLARFSRMHVGQMIPLVAGITSQIKELMQTASKLIEIYRYWAEVELNKFVAQRIADNLPKKHLPDYFNVDKKTGAVDLEQTPKIWTAFNDITQTVWHSPDLQPISRNHYLGKLHDSLPLGPQDLVAEVRA